MKAILLKAYGGVDQLEWSEAPDPEPGPGEVRVELAATSVNPDGSMLGKRAGSVARGELRIPIARRFPLAEAAEAQRLVEEGKAGGKVLLVASRRVA